MTRALVAIGVMAVLIGSSRTYTQSEMTRVPQFDNDRAVSWKSVIPPHTQVDARRQRGHEHRDTARKGGECEQVGVDDLPGLRFGAGRDKLVASRGDCDLRPAHNRHARVVHCGRE